MSPPFTYEGSHDGHTVEGIVDVDSQEIAIQVLEKRGVESVHLADVLEEKEKRIDHSQSQDSEWKPNFFSASRLYCGWILGYYLLAYLIGFYSETRPLPFSIPFVSTILHSSIAFDVALIAFLYFLCTSILLLCERTKTQCFISALTGILLFALVKANIS